MAYAVDNPAEANSDWTDEVIVKSEVILPAEQLSPSKRCRLCDSADHIWVPCFSLGGGVELTPSHLETITLISDIVIRYETDFSSVVCSYCLLKIEEFTVLRDVWKSKDKERHNWDEPSTKPKLPELKAVQKYRKVSLAAKKKDQNPQKKRNQFHPLLQLTDHHRVHVKNMKRQRIELQRRNQHFPRPQNRNCHRMLLQNRNQHWPRLQNKKWSQP
uniref:ZAD domain-containing protein n=1 Tax=Anopheles merus TaxID=30066 RepID=A0A182VMF6_ANOME